MSHLSVADAAAWYREYHPDMPFGEMGPGPCFWCWQEIGVGDEIVVRRPISPNCGAKEGDNGTIIAVHRSKDGFGAIYIVRMTTGREWYFIRAEIRKARDKASPTPDLRVERNSDP